jgi:NAD(P)-dependent dehydrogenase (short-subunit alcohol dehydrogenase family)
LSVAVKSIRANGGRSAFFKADVSNRFELELIFQRIKKEIGFIDICINNAGIAVGTPFFKTLDDEAQRVIEVNLLSNLWCSKYFVNCLCDMNKGGQIVIVSSGHL